MSQLKRLVNFLKKVLSGFRLQLPTVGRDVLVAAMPSTSSKASFCSSHNPEDKGR